MYPFKTLSLGASALCFSLCAVISSALADDSQLFGVADIDVHATPPGPQIVVRNIAGNKNINSLNLAVQGNSFAFGIGGYIECLGTTSEGLLIREGFFLQKGAFGVGRTSLLMSEALPNSSNIDHVSDMDAHSFQVPVALLANPQIDIDPAAIVMAAAEQAPSKVGYLRQNHVIEVKIPIRWESTCASYTRDKVGKKQTIIEAGELPLSFVTKDVVLKIKYEGDPQLFGVNPQLSQGGGLANQVQAGPQGPVIQAMHFDPMMSDHVGACPATTKIRVFYQGHGRGAVRIKIADGNKYIADSQGTAFDGTDGQHHFDFDIQVPKATPSQINRTFSHTLKAEVRTKYGTEPWTPYKQMAIAVWRHRCTGLNPVLGGANTGQKGGYQQQGPGPSPILPKRLQQPEPAPARPARQKIN